MSKAVMISTQPKWCELIASGKKTIEVRKTCPSIETPFKCYIYCTKDAKKHYYINEYGDRQVELITTKIIGEFVCDKIYKIKNQGSRFMIGDDIALTNHIAKESCLEYNNMRSYLGDKDGYAWHISDPVIYDTPKELGEFSVHCKEWGKVDYLPEELECRSCRYCQRNYDDYDPNLVFYNPICYGSRPLTLPFQSWGYVEEV